jgi:hypothetical protein
MKCFLLTMYLAAATTVFAAAPPPVIASMERSVAPLKGVREMTLIPESDRKFFDPDTGRSVEFSFEDKTAIVDMGGGQRGIRHNRD